MNSEQQQKLTEKIIEQITDGLNNGGTEQLVAGLINSKKGKFSLGITVKCSKTKAAVYTQTILRTSEVLKVEVPEDSVDISETPELPQFSDELKRKARKEVEE